MSHDVCACVCVCVFVCRGTGALTFQNICQGDWDIEAVDLEAIAHTNNAYVIPGTNWPVRSCTRYKTVKVTGKAYMCMCVHAFICVCAYR